MLVGLSFGFIKRDCPINGYTIMDILTMTEAIIPGLEEDSGKCPSPLTPLLLAGFLWASRVWASKVAVARMPLWYAASLYSGSKAGKSIYL